MSKITEDRFNEICRNLKPAIESIRRSNCQEPELGAPITDARSAVLFELLWQLYSELEMERPLGLQPVAGATREATLKTAIRRFINAHSVEDFNPYPALDDLLNGLNEGEM